MPTTQYNGSANDGWVRRTEEVFTALGEQPTPTNP